LITIAYFIYKLFKKKKAKENYFDKVFSLIVINANIITIGIFTVSMFAGLLPIAKKEKTINFFCLGEISSKKF
jgi:hypothetical protein